MNSNLRLSRNQLFRIAFSRLFAAVLLLVIVFFVPAGTLAYWQAWVVLAIYLTPMSIAFTYLLKTDPELLERRMRLREKATTQKLVIALSFLIFLLAFILPGLDFRFGWSTVPVPVVVLADILVLSGYVLVFLVFKENTYASRVIEVAQEQKVISTGPYAVIRHPMYAGTLLMYVLTPLALGSWVAMIPAVLLVPVLAIRIVNEESMLARDLKGYPEYQQRVRYRLLPGIW